MPPGWAAAKLSNLTTLLNGDRGKHYPAKSSLSSFGYAPFINAGNIVGGHLDPSTFLYVSAEQYRLLRAGFLQKQDIVLCIRGSLGKSGIYQFDRGAIASSLMIVRPIVHDTLGYVFLFLNSSLFFKGIKAYDNGTAQPNLSAADVGRIVIPIPPEKEMVRIRQKVKAALEILSRISQLNDKVLTLANSLRNKVLSAVFSSDKSYYQTKPLGVALNYIQPGPFIVKRTDYSGTKTPSHPTPVLTPGKTFILGYTDEKEGIYAPSPKAIIFDDFTTSSKMVDFPFKVKSSAMKILESSDSDKYDIEYYFYRLQTIHPILGTHKRFWISIYSPMEVEVPKIDVQKEKVLMFRAIDEAIKCLHK